MTESWEKFGRDQPSLGRASIREALEAAGLVVNTRDYNLAYEAVRRGADAAEQARAAERAERERLRIEPFLAEAHENVAAWGCCEDGEMTAEQFEEAVLDEATKMADEAQEAADEQARAAEREQRELLDYRQRIAGVDAAVVEATALAAEHGWRMERRRGGSESSRYYHLIRGEDDDEVLTLRISDHRAPNGSGWSEEKQERHDGPDVNVVVERQANGSYTFAWSELTAGGLDPFVEIRDRAIEARREMRRRLSY